MSEHEHTFNLALGKVFRKTKQRWNENKSFVKVEQTGLLVGTKGIGAGKRPDILIDDDQFPPVIIEISADPADAEKDAQSRLGEIVKIGRRRVDTVIALHTDDWFRESGNIEKELLEGQRLSYAIYQLIKGGEDEQIHPRPVSNEYIRRFPEEGFLVGSVSDIAYLIPSISVPQEHVHEVGEEVSRIIKDVARGLERVLSEEGKREIAREMKQSSPIRAIQTVCVLWLNALLTQQRLALLGVKDVCTLDITSRTYPNVRDQVNTWRSILDKNWHSIFSPAIRALEQSSRYASKETARTLHNLVDAVHRIENEKIGLLISIGAELFPKLSEDRKQAAAFYTQPATAELLACLTIRASSLDSSEWEDVNLFQKHKIADLACGTGTLLRAGYQRVVSLHEKHGGKRIYSLHKDAMEGGIIGTDISPIASHLTVSSLASLGNGDPYGKEKDKKTQIGWVDVGGGKGQTGSLEYFTTSRIVDLFGADAGVSSGDRDGAGDSVTVPDHSIKWIVMNPPYSKTRGAKCV